MSSSTTYAWHRRIIATATSSSSWCWSTSNARNDLSTSATYARLKRTSTSTYAWNERTPGPTYARDGSTTATNGRIISISSDTGFASRAKTEKEVGSRWTTKKGELESGTITYLVYLIIDRKYDINLNINYFLSVFTVK